MPVLLSWVWYSDRNNDIHNARNIIRPPQADSALVDTNQRGVCGDSIQLLIYRFGPLVHYWCMRYEAKHSFFKRMAGVIGNYTNLPYTLAKRHQQQQCYQFASTTKYLMSETQYGKDTHP